MANKTEQFFAWYRDNHSESTGSAVLEALQTARAAKPKSDSDASTMRRMALNFPEGPVRKAMLEQADQMGKSGDVDSAREAFERASEACGQDLASSYSTATTKVAGDTRWKLTQALEKQGIAVPSFKDESDDD